VRASLSQDRNDGPLKPSVLDKEEPMKTIWAPWRMDYIHEKKEEGCIFCKKPLEKKDEKNLILYRGKRAFVVMNKFPYNNGHLMIVPKRHCTDLEELNINEFQELFDVMKISTQALKASLSPHGFNIGFNIGKAGGAGKDHLHLHVVPRWMGDTNFMPTLAETKIIPETLNETYRKLRSVFEDLKQKRNRHERRR
jgi:ATP adenylyltransferase